MLIGDAVELLKQGKVVTRKDWDGSGMKIRAPKYPAGKHVLELYREKTNDWVYWIGLGHPDLFADDWYEVAA